MKLKLARMSRKVRFLILVTPLLLGLVIIVERVFGRKVIVDGVWVTYHMPRKD